MLRVQRSNVHLLLPLRTSPANPSRRHHLRPRHLGHGSLPLHLRSWYRFRTRWCYECMRFSIYLTTVMLYETQYAQLEELRSGRLRGLWGDGHVDYGFWGGN